MTNTYLVWRCCRSTREEPIPGYGASFLHVHQDVSELEFTATVKQNFDVTDSIIVNTRLKRNAMHYPILCATVMDGFDIKYF